VRLSSFENCYQAKWLSRLKKVVALLRAFNVSHSCAPNHLLTVKSDSTRSRPPKKAERVAPNTHAVCKGSLMVHFSIFKKTYIIFQCLPRTCALCNMSSRSPLSLPSRLVIGGRMPRMFASRRPVPMVPMAMPRWLAPWSSALQTVPQDSAIKTWIRPSAVANVSRHLAFLSKSYMKSMPFGNRLIIALPTVA